jgi:hypothetical protein
VRAPLLVALALGAAAGCSQDADAPAPPRVQDGISVVESGNPCVPEPAVAGPLPAEYPTALAFPEGAVVTYVETRPGTQILSGRVDGDAAGVLEHFRTVAEPAGFAVVRDEDEGRAGRLQLFGATSEVAITVAKLTCPAGSAGFTVSVRTAP